MNTLDSILENPDIAQAKRFSSKNLWFKANNVTDNLVVPFYYDFTVKGAEDINPGDIVKIEPEYTIDSSNVISLKSHPYVVNPAIIGQKVALAGRIINKRQQKNRTFLDLFLGRNKISIVAENENLVSLVNSSTIGQFAEIEGYLQCKFGSVNGNIPFEILLNNSSCNFNSYGKSNPGFQEYVGNSKLDLNTLTNSAFQNLGSEIAIRIPTYMDIQRIGNSVLNCFERYFNEHGFTQYQSTILLKGNAEGGAKPFNVEDYNVQLAQSPQIEKEIRAIAQGPVYTVTSAFRDDPSSTRVHLPEFTSLDVEIPVFNLSVNPMKRIMDSIEGFIAALYQDLHQNDSDIFNRLKISLKEKTENIPRIKFDDAYSLLYSRIEDVLSSRNKKHSLYQHMQHILDSGDKPTFESMSRIVLGKDSKNLSPKAELELINYAAEKTGFPAIFVTHFPASTKPFYVQPSKEEGLSESFDLLLGRREISSGGERVHSEEILKQQMIRSKIWDGNSRLPESFSQYYDAISSGAPAHGGFGIGYERLVHMILGGSVHTKHLKPFIPYPMDNYKK